MSNFVGLDAAMASKPEKKKIGGLNDLFKISDPDEEVILIDVNELDYRHNHNWSKLTGLKEQMLKESIKDLGILQPLIVRPVEDINYPINGKYEILVGNNRGRLARGLGMDKVPCIIKPGLSEDEAESYVNNTNINRDWSELKPSEKAAIIATEYDVKKRRNVRTEILDDIDQYLQQMQNESDDEDASGVRDIAKEHQLEKSSIANYIRIHNYLEYPIKQLLDKKVITLKAAVQLSYISKENQDNLVQLLTDGESTYKCDEIKAKQLRIAEQNKKLNYVSMVDILEGSKKKAGRPKAFKLNSKIVKKFFVNGETEQEIGNVIEEALEMYFGRGDS